MSFEFKPGQDVMMRVSGAGVVSYEDHIVFDVVDGVVDLEDTERRFGLDGKEINPQDAFGFTFSISPKKDEA